MSECFCTSDLIADTLTELEDARRESVLHDSGLPIPNRKKIIQVIKDLQALLFPMAYSRPDHEMSDEHLLSYTDKEIGIGSQQGINQFKMLYNDTLVIFQCGNNGFCQLGHLGKAVFKPDVHVVGVGGEERKAPILLQ